MIFTKPFPKLAPTQVELLFRHSCDVAAALEHGASIVFPKALSHDARSIDYAFLELPPPLVPQLQARAVTPDMMRRAGRALWMIHNGKTDRAGALLHGDFVPHNLFFQTGKLYIIDPHPPENLPWREDMLYGDPGREVAAFVFGIFSDSGLKRALVHRRYYRSLALAFLSGYGPMKPFTRSVYAYAKDVYSMKRTAGFPSAHSLAHCMGAGAMTLLALWRYK